MSARSILLAVAAGLALADASIVTLALPDVLVELDTSVEGVAAVIGVYTVVLAAALVPLERAQRRHGAGHVGAVGLLVFGAASLACGAADSMGVLLTARAVQAVGGAATLVAVFALLEGDMRDHPAGHARRLWLGAAVLSAALGPALGGALTQAFDWRAIFYAQVPVVAAAALACWNARALHPPRRDVVGGDAPSPLTAPAPGAPAWRVAPLLGLGLVSAALTAVLFLLVLLLVAGWSVEPLRAALTVTVLPAAALVGSRIGGTAAHRAIGGSLLVGAGTLALAFLPDDRLLWTVPPQILAGLGMGLALPALGGELLPERDARDAARLLTARHAGIAIALAILAPITAERLDDATQRARERGVAVTLDARLPPQDKLTLAPALLGSVDSADPRGELLSALDRERPTVAAENLGEFDVMAGRIDETLIAAVGESFEIAFLVTGVLAILGALALAPVAPRPSTTAGAALGAAVALAAIAPAAYASAQDERAPAAILIQDPCEERELPGTGGLSGFVQDRAIEALDRSACGYGASREELVLALARGEDADRFEERYGENPRSLGNLVESFLFGG